MAASSERNDSGAPEDPEADPGIQGGNSIGFLDRLTDRLKMGDGLKMSDFGLGMSKAMI